MHKTTLRDIQELIALIERLPARPTPEQVGAIDGQAAIVGIDLRVYEGVQRGDRAAVSAEE